MKNTKEKNPQKSDHKTVDNVETPTPPQVMDPSLSLEDQQNKKKKDDVEEKKAGSEKKSKEKSLAPREEL